jgi:hypothetical protein
MEEILSLKTSFLTTPIEASIPELIISFLLCMALSFLLSKFYISKSLSLTGKNHISSILPILSGIIFLVIIIVKSSLALSLGLVGALSIVRFRTPIKEPEELVYLFLAIAIGLGFGAGYVLVTTLITILLMVIINFWVVGKKTLLISQFNTVINWNDEKLSFDEIISTLRPMVDSLKVIRVESSEQKKTIIASITPNGDSSIDQYINSLKKLDDNITISMYESDTNW